MLLRPRADFYADGHPTAEDGLLAVEVADTSLATDIAVKVPPYAGHGVREVWLVDLEHHRVPLTAIRPAAATGKNMFSSRPIPSQFHACPASRSP